ncbi:hypothetical protein C8R43DRAFT_942169 [Mycena crocata]|nr:hypothetical protein C8R43DRAFT_942169 [Mycena crocata]
MSVDPKTTTRRRPPGSGHQSKPATEKMDVDKPQAPASGSGASKKIKGSSAVSVSGPSTQAGKKGSSQPKEMDVDKDDDGTQPATKNSGMRGGGVVYKSDLYAKPGKMATSGYFPAITTPREDLDEWTGIYKRMNAGEWRLHETEGVPVCKTVIREKRIVLEESGGSDVDQLDGDELPKVKLPEIQCECCIGYLRHVAAARENDDGSLAVVYEARELVISLNNRAQKVAELSGQLAAQKETVATLREEARALNETLIEVAAKKMLYEDRYTQCQKDYDSLLDQRDELHHQVTDLKDKLREYEQRSRKRMHYSDNRSTTDRHYQPTQAYPAFPKESTAGKSGETVGLGEDTKARDEELREMLQHTIVLDINKLRGTPQIIVHGPLSLDHPPKQAWALDEHGYPADIMAWNTARQHAEMSQCWSSCWQTVQPYIQARIAELNNEPLTELQKYILANYRMPLWTRAVFQRTGQSALEINYNNKFWNDIKEPYAVHNVPVTLVAAHIQHRGRVPEGCPFVDVFQSVDLRLVRGLLTSPKKPAHAAARTTAVQLAKKLIGVLGIPNNYRDMLDAGRVVVAPATKLEHFSLEGVDDLLDTTIVTRLAAMGLTQDEPPGSHFPSGDIYPRQPGLPWPRACDNDAFSRAMTLPGIPIEGVLDTDDQKKATLRISMVPQRSSHHPRGGAQIRGGRGGVRGRGTFHNTNHSGQSHPTVILSPQSPTPVPQGAFTFSPSPMSVPPPHNYSQPVQTITNTQNVPYVSQAFTQPSNATTTWTYSPAFPQQVQQQQQSYPPPQPHFPQPQFAHSSNGSQPPRQQGFSQHQGGQTQQFSMPTNVQPHQTLMGSMHAPHNAIAGSASINAPDTSFSINDFTMTGTDTTNNL